MAVKYKRAGAGNWNTDASWSTTSGGAADTVKPTAADDVILDSNSGDLTIDAAAVCRSIDLTSGTGTYGGTLLHNAFTLTIGDGTAGAGNVALNFGATFTYTISNVIDSAIAFISTSATVQTVNFNGKTTGNVTYNAASNGSWQMTGQHNMGATALLTLTAGTFDTNGQVCNWGKLRSIGAATRVLTLGASTVTLSGVNATERVLDFAAGGLTFNANTSTVIFSGILSGGLGALVPSGKNFNDIQVTGGGTNMDLGGGFQCANFTITGTAVKTNVVKFSGNVVVTGTLTINGNSVTNRILISSATLGTARTLTAAVNSITNVDFSDITAAGAANWNLSAITGNSGDCGGNTGITFTAGVDQTWSGSTGGSWSTNAWTTRVPLPQDNAFISSAFSASQVITGDMPRLGKNISFVGSTGTPQFTNSTTVVSIFGSLTFISGMTLAGTASIIFAGRISGLTITTAGLSFTQALDINAPSGIYTLQDNLTGNTRMTLNNGTFSAGIGNITLPSFRSVGVLTRALNMGSGIWTLNSTGTIWDMTTITGLTFDKQTSTIIVSNATPTAKTFIGGGLTYNNITFSGDNITVTGANTFAIMAINTAGLTNGLILTAGVTQIVSSVTTNGFASNLAKLVSSSAGSPATISCPSGIISVDYMSIKDSTATGGAKFYAGANSTDVSGNTGWLFRAYPNTTLTESITFADTLVRVPNRILSEVLSHTDIIVRALNRDLSESLSLTDILNKALGRNLTDGISMTDTLIKVPQRNLLENITLTDIFTRAYSRTFTEVLTLTDFLRHHSRWFRRVTQNWYTKNNNSWYQKEPD